MTTHKNDGTYKVLDPMLKDGLRAAYSELSGCLVYISKGGWLIAKGPSHIMFFLDPFTKPWINLPHLFGGAYGVAFSCSLMSKGLPTFLGFRSVQWAKCWTLYASLWWQEVDFSWIWEQLSFPIEFQQPHFYERVFLLLGRNGCLGVYNPIAGTFKCSMRSLQLHISWVIW